MKILIACEFSGMVREAFAKLNKHCVVSCDLLDTQIACANYMFQQNDKVGNYHYKGDVNDILNESWDMIIAFPECTHLASSGAAHFEQKRKDGRQQQGIDFFMLFANHPCEKIAIENPVGIMSSVYKKPSQIIEPYYFGDSFKKRTCLWLKNLNNLVPTNIVDPGEIVIHGGKRIPKWYSNAKVSERKLIRSKTFPGIANAMAQQWG